ncbi:hypothetical protein C4D60_Mb06t23440 [Musa balbisiana]|uniref:Uncharacterized protein n=1 Tax=Musa balbisiana TaxID=52838 RepID=A0A4S8IRE2_MUSBA|nr:hypothetical protein C4D60_Mb06t23440 [Musa balbisiana]
MTKHWILPHRPSEEGDDAYYYINAKTQAGLPLSPAPCCPWKLKKTPPLSSQSDAEDGEVRMHVLEDAFFCVMAGSALLWINVSLEGQTK